MVNTSVNWLGNVLILFLVIFLTSQSARTHDVYKSIENPEAKAFGNRVCTNKECAKRAAMLIHDRNEKISPCEDFGAHVCGKFKINSNEKSYFSEGWLNIHRELRRMLQLQPEPNEKPWYSLARSFYKKCLDTTSDVFPDLRVLLDEIGGWPALTAGTSDWTEFGESFEEYIANIHRRFRADFLFKIKVSDYEVAENTRQNVIYFTPALAEFNSSHLKDLSELGSRLNPKLKSDYFNAELAELLMFYLENKVLHLKLDDEQTYGPLALFKEDFYFDFAKYLNHLYGGIAPIDANTIVLFESPNYFKQFHNLLRPENKRKVTNYAVISVLQHLFDLRTTYINKIIPTREANCLFLMYSDLLVYPVSQMYVEKHLDIDAVQKVVLFFKLINNFLFISGDRNGEADQRRIEETLKNASWLDHETRANALFKVDKMADSVGYPENLFNDTYVEENWNIPTSPPSESFYQLAARMERKKIASSLLKITQPLDTISWGMPILFVNAFYDPENNKMVILQGLFQPPFFDKNLPDYINYATMGFIVSHEIMHGFDNNGRFYDAFGNEVDWWNNATSDKYDEKTVCYVKQYTAEGIDGMLTLGENIADNVGFKLAYGAYKRLLKKRGMSSEPALPAFEKFSLEQMFFIAYNHEWCSNGQTEGEPNDPHPPSDVRAKMVARNSKQFSKAFSCKKTSPMNPEEKCSIW